jgi:LmbE family N-acetylglucosaminyl deacetylase
VTPLPPDRVPVPLPHYRLRGDALHFLVSRRPAAQFDAGERRVWEALDGAATVADLVRRFPGEAEAALQRFVAAGLCLLVETGFRSGRRRVLVIEPHADDGVLSLGGTLWSRRHDCEFTILTLAGVSNFTSYYYLDHDYFDVDEISALRGAESALLARALGGRHVALPLAEGPLRYRPGRWSVEWFRRHRASVSAFISRTSGPAELAEWTDALALALAAHPADEIWAPLGIAPHTDHELARNAFLALLEQDPELPRRVPVRLYQEVPYAARYPHVTARVLAELAAEGASLEPEPVPIADAFADKLRLVSLFGSQFKLASMQPDLESAARAAAGAGGGMAEMLYRVAAAPAHPDDLALSVVAPEVKALAGALGPWLARHRDARRVRIFLRPPAGRWADDARALLAALPGARLEVRAAGEALPEIEELRSPRVTVGPIADGARAWALAMLRADLRGPAPTLIVTFADRVREGSLLARLLPLSDTLVVPGMNHLALALRWLERGGVPRP